MQPTKRPFLMLRVGVRICQHPIKKDVNKYSNTVNIPMEDYFAAAMVKGRRLVLAILLAYHLILC